MINPQSALGLSAEEAGAAEEMTITSKVSMNFLGYDEDLEIRLPPEANAAADILANLTAGGQASPLALASNESELEENLSANEPVHIKDDRSALGEILNQSESLNCRQTTIDGIQV